jgi:capsule polysaccharide modification protein KpsS
MDSKELREMSIDNAKLALHQHQQWGGPASYAQIIEELRELKEQNDMMDRIHYLDDAGFRGLTKMCGWIETTYSKYGYVSILGKQKFVDVYIQIIKNILVLRQYTDKEKQMLNELRMRYINKDLGVDDSLPF